MAEGDGFLMPDRPGEVLTSCGLRFVRQPAPDCRSGSAYRRGSALSATAHAVLRSALSRFLGFDQLPAAAADLILLGEKCGGSVAAESAGPSLLGSLGALSDTEDAQVTA